LLTLLGGAWLVSSKLTSERPAGVAGVVGDFPREKTVEARLWEDPFKIRARSGDASRLPVIAPHDLRERIQEEADGRKGVLTPPVMIPGGFYSEDQETRIRSRFAIASALSQASYVPEDAERIGAVTLPWPTTQSMKQLEDQLVLITKDNPQRWLVNKWSQDETVLGLTAATAATRLDLRYEWYRQQRFEPLSTGASPPLYVLVLWLNERYFEDKPLLRLPLLLAPIIEALRKTHSMFGDERVALIGPGHSSTLRRMLPEWEPGRKTAEDQSQSNNSKILQNIKDSKILQNIEVYSATARAMDATLVQDNHDTQPRGSVGKALQDIGFNTFHNFAATDDQLASEILDELALRGVDFKEEKNHLVLLSEGDNFYTQVLSLTYKAVLATRQGFVNSPVESVESVRSNISRKPTNLSSFVYLRGLDGQTVGKDSGAARNSGSEESKPANPTSLEDLRKWSPDSNKAEGSAQFDYLSRLGDRLADLEKQLSKKIDLSPQGEHIKAIGIMGTDVYDTLLILQALRHQFPNALFFTTDLDTRFWHPREQAWSRNLLVTSGYGLRLHPDLQKKGPPFRDSIQTAQFTAALAALGYKELPTLKCVPPRRFEIAKNGAVDLSVPRASSDCGDPQPPLHPKTRIPPIKTTREWGVFWAICLIPMLLLTFLFKPLRRLTWEVSRFKKEVLSYGEEDVGGPAGALTLVVRLRKLVHKQKDSWGQWLEGEVRGAKLRVSPQGPTTDAMRQAEQRGGGSPANNYTLFLDRIEKAQRSLDAQKAYRSLDAQKEKALLQEIDRCKEALLREVINGLNRFLQRRSSHPAKAVEPTRWPVQQAYRTFSSKSPQQLYHGRKRLDRLLQQLVKNPHKARAFVDRDAQKALLYTTKAAHEASLELYKLRCR
jgi:hypothetical protein